MSTTTNYSIPTKGGFSPWDTIISTSEIAPGIWSVNTASHGGLFLSPERAEHLRSAIPGFRPFTGSFQWLEEDCDVTAALILWENELTDSDAERERIYRNVMAGGGGPMNSAVLREYLQKRDAPTWQEIIGLIEAAKEYGSDTDRAHKLLDAAIACLNPEKRGFWVTPVHYVIREIRACYPCSESALARAVQDQCIGYDDPLSATIATRRAVKLLLRLGVIEPYDGTRPPTYMLATQAETPRGWDKVEGTEATA